MQFHCFHQQLMRHVVKEARYIHVDHPGIFPYVLSNCCQCLMGVLQWTISIGMLRKYGLKAPFQIILDYLLTDPVPYGWDPQLALAAIVFRYFYFQYTPRVITA